jgi:hypothetical protein
MGDSGARPQTIRDPAQQRKSTLIAAAAVILFALTVVGIVVAVSGDGKGSGNLQRAFGGYISPEDEVLLEKINDTGYASNEYYLKVTKAAGDQDLDRLARVADRGRTALDEGLRTVAAVENDGLQSELGRVLRAKRAVFVAYGGLATYLRIHGTGKSTPHAQRLLARAAQAERRMRLAERHFFTRVAPYMNPEQRRLVREQQRSYESQLK